MASSQKVVRVVLQSVIDKCEQTKQYDSRHAVAKAILRSRWVQKQGITEPADVLRAAEEAGCTFRTPLATA